MATGAIAKIWGPSVAGMFLAFPALLPASLTLVKRHDGRDKAVDDARGGRLGSLGLVGFALIVVGLAAREPAWVVLVVAGIAWLAIAVAAWFVTYGRR